MVLPTAGASPRLARVLSPFEVLLLTMSALSPVLSVFIYGNGVLHIAGTGAALAFLAGGIFSALFALLYAELAAAFPSAGGVYPSVTALVGPRWSFSYVMLLVPMQFPLLAFTALGMGVYLHTLIPAIPTLALAAGGLVLAASIAILGIKSNATITGLFLAVELGALAVLTGVALTHLPADPLRRLFDPRMLMDGQLVATPPATLALAAVSGAWSTAGASWALNFAEEMRDVQLRIGRVVAWAGTIASLTIAIPFVLVVLAIRDVPTALASEAPLAAFLRESAGPLPTLLITVGVIASVFNALIAIIMGQSRFLFSVGRDRVYPAAISNWLGRVHRRWRSPYAATLTLVVAAAAMMLAGERVLLILISGNIFDYILAAAAVLLGRKLGKSGRFFASPFYPAIPLIGLAGGLAIVIANLLDAEAGRPSLILLSTVFFSAMLFYGWRRKRTGHDLVLSGT